MSSFFSFLTFERPAHPIPANNNKNSSTTPDGSENEGLMDSLIMQQEKWSPYQNFVVFISTVLLWFVFC